jgi:multidrug resistance efflux pump
VRPGTTTVSVVDRSRVRVTVDAPERDFAVARIGAPVHIDMLSTGAKVNATVQYALVGLSVRISLRPVRKVHQPASA